MFNIISWHEYITFLAISTALYYLIVYFLYFRNVGTSVLQKGELFNSELTVKEQAPTLFDQNAEEEHKLQNLVYACMDELNAFFENQKKTKAVKRELMFGLHTIFQKYPTVRNSDYKESITNFIAKQSENICSIHLSAEELKGVWFG